MTDRLALGDFAQVLRGHTPANTSTEPVGPRFYGMAEISSDGASEARYVPAEELSHVEYLHAGDLVVGLLGSVGHSAIVHDELAGAVLGRECAAIRLRPGERRVTLGWLAAWAQSDDFQAQVDANLSGATMPRLSVRALPSFLLPVLPLESQLEIEELRARFDEAIRGERRLLSLLEISKRAEIERTVQAATVGAVADMGADTRASHERASARDPR